MIYKMVQPGSEPVLAGSVNGKVAFAGMIKAINREPPTPIALFLDFCEVEVATASYLRESVFALKSYLRDISSKYYSVVANANELVLDELLTISNAKNDAIIGCHLSVEGDVSDIGLIGQLDPKQQMTFDLVNDLKEADAGSLMRAYTEDEYVTGTTAWNNRLAGLVRRGLIREFSRGRAKFYRPVLEASE